MSEWSDNRALINILHATVFKLIFHPLEVVPRYRDPQPQEGENYSYFSHLRPNIYNLYWFVVLFGTQRVDIMNNNTRQINTWREDFW